MLSDYLLEGRGSGQADAFSDNIFFSPDLGCSWCCAALRHRQALGMCVGGLGKKISDGGGMGWDVRAQRPRGMRGKEVAR